MSDVFHALGHPARRDLVEQLRGQPLRAGDLGVDLGVSREAVSKHLRVLRDAGVVDVERRGRERWYRLDVGALEEVDAWLTPYRHMWEQRLDALATEIARGKKARPVAPAADRRREGA